MKALTLHQPWASLIAIGAKHIETRHWSTSYRGPLAIHAGARKPTYAERFVGEYRTRGIGSYAGGAWILEGPGLPPYRSTPRLQGQRLPLGAIVATCELVDVVPIVKASNEISKPGKFIHVYPGLRPGSSALWLCELRVHGGIEALDLVEDQRPYGNFAPGRYAWLLDDIKPVDPPVPCRGHQGLWNWTP